MPGYASPDRILKEVMPCVALLPTTRHPILPSIIRRNGATLRSLAPTVHTGSGDVHIYYPWQTRLDLAGLAVRLGQACRMRYDILIASGLAGIRQVSSATARRRCPAMLGEEASGWLRTRGFSAHFPLKHGLDYVGRNVWPRFWWNISFWGVWRTLLISSVQKVWRR